MSSDININLSAFGQLSDSSDTLIIEISDYLIQFCELDSKHNKPQYICHYSIDSTIQNTINDHLIYAIKHFQLSKKQYQLVYINYFNPQFTLCPSNFYNSEHSRAMLELNVGNTNNHIILTDDIRTDIKLIYTIDDSLKSALDNLFPNHQLKHTLTILSSLMLQSDELIKENILLSIHSNYIEIVVKQGHQLLLSNQYTIKTQEDILYYILFILEQYHLNHLTVNITLVGNIDVNSSLIVALKKYIKHIHLALGHKTINWDGISGAPQHYNYTLLNRIFCE